MAVWHLYAWTRQAPHWESETYGLLMEDYITVPIRPPSVFVVFVDVIRLIVILVVAFVVVILAVSILVAAIIVIFVAYSHRFQLRRRRRLCCHRR